ncbi:hypothetical protein F66182_10033 [Fusarium sp. NRRL 66182]|nr:hypothetical protein F66182_10033 [Fusarium sp. NRRL 66182]
MDNQPNAHLVKELHDDLVRKYKTHETQIETIWRSLNRLQRAKCMRAGAAEGRVLKHASDASLGNVYKFIPEWNLADITEPNSDFLLDMLKHRSTTSLWEQYFRGPNGAAGDGEHINEMARTKNLRHTNAFKNCYTFFMSEKYGESFKIADQHLDETLAAFKTAIDSGVCVPQSLGELIIMRQIHLLQSLNIIIEDILDQGSKTRGRSGPSKQSKVAPTAPLSKSTADETPMKPTFQDVIAAARDQKSSLEEYLSLLRTEPTVLCPSVNAQFFTRSELVPDEKGRSLPVHTDKYVSPAVFEVIHHAVQGIAIWESIAGLLDLLEKPSLDKLYKSTALLKRQIATGMGSKWFKRISNVYDNRGNAKLSIKGKPEELTRTDPQLHYLLRLCQPDVTAPKALEWMQKLSDLYKAHPSEREKLYEREARTLYHVAAIVIFVQDISSVSPLPSASHKKGKEFVSALQELEVELNQLKKGVDLRHFAVPIDNMLEPGMAAGALEALDQHVVDKAGTKMGFLYQDALEKMFHNLEEQYRHTKDQMDKASKAVFIPIDTSPQDQEKRVESRREKEKTRPSHSSTYGITPTSDSMEEEKSAPSSQKLNVSPATSEVFKTLFDKSQSRGSVDWTAFEAAMAELGFSILPRFGSVYTFRPPETMSIKRPLSLHRPHQSQIEGYLTLILARRLSRAYGWNENTFETV